METPTWAGVMPVKRNPWLLAAIALTLALGLALLLHAWYRAAVLRQAPEEEGLYIWAGLAALVLGAPTSIGATLLLGPLEPLLDDLEITSLQFVLGAMVVNWTLMGFVIGWWNQRSAVLRNQTESR